MKKYFNIFTLYIFLWCIYYLQGVVYTGSGIISQAILIIMLLISIYYFFDVNSKHSTSSFIKVLNVFLGIITIYGIILLFDPSPLYYNFMVNEEVNKIGYLRSAYISLLPIYPMLAFAKQNILKEETIQAATIILIISVTITYFKTEQEMLQEALEIGSMRDEFTNNTAYSFLQLLPLLFFWKNRPVLQYILMGYIMTFIVMGMKRGAIIIGILCVLWFLNRSLSSASNRSRRIIIVLTTIMAIIGIYFINNFISNSDYFQYRIEQTIGGSSSNRDNIYTTLWDYSINQDSIVNIIWGNGAAHTIKVVGCYAHSDWLELLICQGLFGVLIYVLYFTTLFIEFRRNKKNDIAFNILGMCIMIMFISSIFSMSYNSLSISMAIALGYSLSTTSKKYTLS